MASQPLRLLILDLREQEQCSCQKLTRFHDVCAAHKVLQMVPVCGNYVGLRLACHECYDRENREKFYEHMTDKFIGAQHRIPASIRLLYGAEMRKYGIIVEWRGGPASAELAPNTKPVRLQAMSPIMASLNKLAGTSDSSGTGLAPCTTPAVNMA